jgi:hypothetical protein
MARTAKITLYDNSTRGTPPRVFETETVDAYPEADTVIQGIDGAISRASHPTKIIWRNGHESSLANVTNVRIEFSTGETIEGPLNTNYGISRAVVGGIEFFVGP